MEQIRLVLAPIEQVFDKTIKASIDTDLSKYLINYLIIICLIYSADKFPQSFKETLTHYHSQIILLFLSIYLLTKDFSKSVVITVSVIVALFILNRENVENFTDLEVMPGCKEATINDLLSLFNGDRTKLVRAMYSIGIPLNLELSESNAALIATYFVNHGKKVSGTCQAPHF